METKEFFSQIEINGLEDELSNWIDLLKEECLIQNEIKINKVLSSYKSLKPFVFVFEKGYYESSFSKMVYLRPTSELTCIVCFLNKNEQTLFNKNGSDNLSLPYILNNSTLSFKIEVKNTKRLEEKLKKYVELSEKIKDIRNKQFKDKFKNEFPEYENFDTEKRRVEKRKIKIGFFGWYCIIVFTIIAGMYIYFNYYF